jgi:site-specific recombinase XerD
MSVSLLDGFETYVENELGLSPNTFSAYVYDVREFLHFIGTQELSARLIEAFISHLQRQELKSTTIRRKQMAVRCLCHHLISLGRLDPNTLDIIDSVRTERGTPDALDPKDMDALMDALANRVSAYGATNVRRDLAIILVLYHSGLRVSELCQLDLNDINLAKRTIRVNGKGNRDRVVPTTQKCIDAIKSYVGLDRIAIIEALFVQSNGKRLSRRAISDMLTSISRRAGVKHTTAHTLRRTCATELMNKGMDIEAIRTLIGHQNLSTTQAYLATSIDRIKAIHRKCHPFGEKHNETQMLQD